MKKHTIFAMLGCLLAWTGTGTDLRAAAAENPALDYDNHGEITLGYRFSDIAGYRPKFAELFNLRSGFRVEDVSLSGTARDRKKAFSDRYTLSATGLGGDPFSTAQFTAGKTGVYDFRATWRQSYYYWNQNDDVALPISTAAAGLSTGLTGNHDWATVRKLGSINLTINATNTLRFNIEAFRTTTNGALRTTRSLDFFSSPSYWGSFARANPYPLDAPLADRTQRIAGGADYSWRTWNFHYSAGYQAFTETSNLNPIGANEVSINPITLSTNEPLTALTWAESRRLTTPISELSFRGEPYSWLEWRGSYFYSRHRGPATLETAFTGIAPFGSAGGPLTPYSVTEGSASFLQQPNHTIREGFTLRLHPWWAFNADYRYSRFSSESTVDVTRTFNGAPASGSSEIVWANGIGDFDASLAFTPTAKISVRPGVRLTKTNIRTATDGVLDAPRSIGVKRAQPELRFSYRPTSNLSFRGDVTNSVTTGLYTAMSPHSRTAGHLIARYRPRPNLTIENALTISGARILENNYRNRIHSNSTTLSYGWNDRIATFGSLNYQSFYAQGDIVYARGVSPLTSVLRNQEIHRIWQAGVEIKPIHAIGARITGSYDRVTGAGVIDGEPPAYGPLRWPLVTGTLFADCKKVGRLSIDLQRTYYIEELVPVNNFSANLLTLRFTRSF